MRLSLGRWMLAAALPGLCLSVLALSARDAGAQTCALCAPGAVCTSLTGTKVRLRKLDDGVGNERLYFRALFDVPPEIPIDLLTTGIRLVLSDATGVLADATIPGGQLDPVQGRGWLANGSGSSWTYHDSDGEVGGIKKVVAKRHSTRTGEIKMIIFGQDLDYAMPVEFVTFSLELPTVDSTGTVYCGERNFPVEFCRPRNQGNKLLCR